MIFRIDIWFDIGSVYCITSKCVKFGYLCSRIFSSNLFYQLFHLVPTLNFHIKKIKLFFQTMFEIKILLNENYKKNVCRVCNFEFLFILLITSSFNFNLILNPHNFFLFCLFVCFIVVIFKWYVILHSLFYKKNKYIIYYGGQCIKKFN